jgi:hypothetical protein
MGDVWCVSWDGVRSGDIDEGTIRLAYSEPRRYSRPEETLVHHLTV